MADQLMRRAERQRQTRDALVQTARAVFARDGYHAARLDVIAREAGYSKGAVYSNFDSKADLFLAVIDVNLEIAAPGGWDPFEPAGGASHADDDACAERPTGRSGDPHLDELVRGFALATLEFIASAARDDALRVRMATQMEAMIRLNDPVAERADTDDELTTADRAALLSLGGVGRIDQRLLRIGFRRLVDPRRAVRDRVDDTPGASGLHRQEYRADVLRSIQDDDPSPG